MAFERLAVDALVERDQAPVAEVGADLAQGLERERRVQVVRADEAAERAADLDRAQRYPVPNPAPELVDEPTQRGPELDLVGARVTEALVQANDLGAAAVAAAEAGVGRPTARDDPRHGGQRLDVVDDRRPMQVAALGRVRGTRRDLSAQALDRVDQ